MIGLVPLPANGPTNAFYESWADYLQPKSRMFLSVLQMMCQGIADLCYDLANAVLTAWNAAWKLAQFSTIFTESDGTGQDISGYSLTQYIGTFFMIGIIILAVMMAVQLIQFNLTSGRRGKEWPSGIVTAIIIIALVPMLISGGTKVAKSMNQAMLGTNTSSAQKGGHSILTDIWRNNSVDLKKLAQADFKVKEGNIHDYSPIKKTSSNAIVKSSIFTDTMDDKAQKGIKNDKAKAVFANKQGESTTEKVDKGGWLKGTEEVYPRVKVNWIGIIAAEIVFAIIGFLAIIELIVRFFRLAYYSLTLLALAFRDMEGKKAMQILHVMEGSILGMALLPLNLILFFAFVQWGMTAISDQNLSWGPYTIISVALLLAAGKGLLSGFALIDDWTGMPTGHGNTASGLIGAAVTGATVGRATKGVTGTAAHMIGGVTRGAAKSGKKAVGSAQSMKAKISQAGKNNQATQQAIQAGANAKFGSDGTSSGKQKNSATTRSANGLNGLPVNAAASQSPATGGGSHETMNKGEDNGQQAPGTATRKAGQTAGSNGLRTPAQAHNPGTQPISSLSSSSGSSQSATTSQLSQTTGQTTSTTNGNLQSTAKPAMTPPKPMPASSVSQSSSSQQSATSVTGGTSNTTAPTNTPQSAMPGRSVSAGPQPTTRLTQPTNQPMTSQPAPNQHANNAGQTVQNSTGRQTSGQPTRQTSATRKSSNAVYDRLEKEVQNDLRQAYPKKDNPQRS